MWVTSSAETVLTPTAVALGNFDGVHQGHQRVILPVLNFAIISPASSTSQPVTQVSSFNEIESVYATVATFNPHPQEFFTGNVRQLLTPPEEKALQLQRLGVQQLVLLPFDRDLAKLTPPEFVEQILVRQLRVQHVSVGADFCFGHRRSGMVDDLKALCHAHQIAVTIVPLQTSLNDTSDSQPRRISSSDIRTALLTGDLNQANQLLGRCYQLIGQVVYGQQVGRTIGFPTANLQLPPQKFLPRDGVYAVRVNLPTSIAPISGVMNLGDRPTIDSIGKAELGKTIELHLLDWSGDLYGQTLTVDLEQFLRPEQKFGSLMELKAQIQTDCEVARAMLATPIVTYKSHP